MLEGIIVKGIGGFYYVKTEEGIYECRARGVFRDKNISPLVGDKVIIRINKEDGSGYIEKIFERSSQLIRPPVANVSQAVIVMSIKNPDINYWLLDRFLVMAEHEKLKICIVINKVDLASEDEIREVEEIYEKTQYQIIKTSILNDEGIDELKNILKNNITVFAGPSGVGKSSLLNKLHPDFKLKTGNVSKKANRGNHTTRHVELLYMGMDNTYVLDTPGFSSLNIDFIKEETELGNYFYEINKYKDKCRFTGCLHYREPDCEVKRQVDNGNISARRYNNYLQFLEEIRNIRRY